MDETLDRAPCGYLAFRDDGYIVELNATLGEWLEHDPAALAGKHVDAVLTVASRIFYQTHLFPLVTLHGRAEEIFLSLRTRGGAPLPVLANAARREEAGGAVTRCVFLPLRERRKYEDELLEAKRAAEDAARNNEELVRTRQELERHARDLDRKVQRLEQRTDELTRLSRLYSHDLRAPLRKIGTFAELLRERDGAALSPDGAALLGRIRSETVKMDALLQSLREYATVGATVEEPTPVPLEEVVREAERQVRARWEGVGLELSCGALPTVAGHREQLVLLFAGLLDNAVKFRRGDAARVEIDGCVVQGNSYRRIEGRYRWVDFARVEVRDRGTGFDPAYREYVFDILAKVSLDSPGLGFGLAIARKVVDHHHGSIEIDPEPGAGTRVTLQLPLEG